MANAIDIRGLGKCYRLGEGGASFSLRETLSDRARGFCRRLLGS